jgi:hypothetical protein
VEIPHDDTSKSKLLINLAAPTAPQKPSTIIAFDAASPDTPDCDPTMADVMVEFIQRGLPNCQPRVASK